MRPDEAALWAAIQDGTWPRVAYRALGIPTNRAAHILGKWSRQGCYDYGVSLDMGWVVPGKRPRSNGEPRDVTRRQVDK